nr:MULTISPECIES: Spy/CpxP family protein refolding chaperone [unclassified Endozoicomonas]
MLVFCTVGVKAASTEALMDMDEAYGQLEQKLNLTDEQKPKVEAILKESRAVIKEIRASDENRLSKARALRKNRDETNKRLATVLNDQQMQTYRELRKEMRDRLKEYRGQKKSE